MTNYVIVSPARCGSTWLICGLEYKYKLNNFNECFSIEESQIRIDGETSNLKNYNQAEKILIIKTHTPYIVKVFTDSIIDLNLLSDKDTLFIWLYRKNLAEHVLSFYFAMKTKIFNIEKDQVYQTPDKFDPIEKDKNFGIQFEYDFKNFYTNIFNTQKEIYEKYHHMFDVEIAYEDLFKNNPWGITESSTVKLNTYKQEWIDSAENFIDSIIGENNGKR